jgi:hypothetical protein
MSDERETGLVAIRDAREQVITQLSDAFANDRLDVDEFERRLTLAHQADSFVRLEELTRDLAPAPAPALPLTHSTMPTALARVREAQTMLAIMGGVTRRGRWTLPRKLRVVAIMGGVDLDFREAVLPAGVTELVIVACMGGANLVVPPHLAVEMNGSAIMGGFDHSDRAPSVPDPDRPVLRVHGFACMGGVSIQTRLPGESDREAQRRRRRERRALHASERLLPRGDR